MLEKEFRTGDGKCVNYAEMVAIIANYIKQNPEADYEITVGTDSQNHDKTKMVEVIAVCRVGNGGIFFYRVEFMDKIMDLRQKIYEETSRSLENAHGLLDEIYLQIVESDEDFDLDKLNIHFVVHCDIGRSRKSKTRVLVQEIMGWVEAEGFECVIKPDSYTASGIANKFSK
jgi:predicted RNase H-related nuclease YkuK (DUF458 family)